MWQPAGPIETVYVCVCNQVQDKLQDKLLGNEVFSNLETLYADGKAMKETLEEAQDLVEETRDSGGSKALLSPKSALSEVAT